MKTADLRKHVWEGRLLFSRFCKESYLLYQKEGVILPGPYDSELLELAKAAENTFGKVLQKAQAFYKGAIFYLSRNNSPLGVFLLQQAAEYTLRGILQAITYRNYITHHLKVLRQQALPLLPELTQLLPANRGKANCLLHRFGKAYIQAKYQPDYEMPLSDISQVKEWVENSLA